MATFSVDSVTQQIKSLVDQRKQHEAAIARIDGTLERIGSMLGGPGAPAAVKRGRGRPPGSKNQAGSRGRRKRFSLTGEESIVEFIRKHGSPTTKEVNQHWKSEGRGGSADNALTKLVKLKQLKRVNEPGLRGSKYSVA